MAILKQIYYFFSSREKAGMLNDDGEIIQYVKIKEKSNTFEYKTDDKSVGLYNVKRNQVKPLVYKGWLFSHHTYFYNIGNPDPLSFSKPHNGWMPVIDPKLFSILMEAEVIKQLNTVNNPISKKTIIWIIIICAVLGVLYYLAQSGNLTKLTGG
jgi:hypothetical protein